ncbi:MAG TPA: hypothetical protein VFG02_02610 [Nitrospirota bacterium]|nr:hypothetical protein [Nitrospirota bacterium]
MIHETRTSGQAAEYKLSAAALSLAAASSTIILASITHAYEFGHRAFIDGAFDIALLFGMSILYRRTNKKVFLVLYGLFNAGVVIGFGLLNGFWNHACKVFLYYLHSNALPPFLAKLFTTPHIGSYYAEGAGVLTFVVSMFAAYYGYKFLMEGH